MALWGWRPIAVACLAVAVSGVLGIYLFPQLRGSRYPIHFRDVTSRSGITWRHTDGSSGQKYIVETVTAGVATFDYDGDGWIDIYFLNGAPLPGHPSVTELSRNALYRNLGGWRFVDVTVGAAVGDLGFGLGVAVGDYNNDGFGDLYVNNFGPNVFYRNNGDGTFSDVTAETQLSAGDRVGAGAAFLDIELDGDLDLYVANYVQVDLNRHPQRTAGGFPVYPGPMDFMPEGDLLFRNNGDGTFADITAEAGIAAYAGTGMGMICADFDRDADTDIFVLNDVAGNFIFINDGRGHFSEEGLRLGGAFNADGRALGSMGIDCGDYDLDGWLDFYGTSYARELAVLYRNLRGEALEDVTIQAGAGASTFAHVTWGVAFLDADNDTDRDLFVACGHLQDNIEQFDSTGLYEAPNLLLENTGQGRFADITGLAGDGLWPRRSSRGVAADDLDHDGRVDLVVLNSRREPTILRNDSSPAGHWLQIVLLGRTGNRDAVGSQVGVATGNLTQWAEVHSGRGYQSHFGTCLHFGVGESAEADWIEIRWHAGPVERIHHIGANRRILVVENCGIVASWYPDR